MPYRSPLYDIPSDLAQTVFRASTFRGRARRTEVWTYFIVGSLLVDLLEIVIALVGVHMSTYNGDPTVASTVLTLAYCVPIPAMIARRLHDIGWSGWFALIVPLTLGLSAVSKSAEPSLYGIPKIDFALWGWLSLAGVLIILTFSLLPPSETVDQHGLDPRLG